MTTVDLAIIGKGVTGSAAGFVQNYGNLRSVAHFERQRGPGLVNSNVSNNSQTLHEGGIETNYGLQAALRVNAGAQLVKNYIDTFLPETDDNPHRTSITLNKMVIGVGEAEVAKLTQRYNEFKPYFPEMRLLQRDELGDVEPNVLRGRDPNQPIVALNEGRGKAVNYQRLAESMVARSGQGSAEFHHVYHQGIDAVEKLSDGTFKLSYGKEDLCARAVIVAAGSPSLAMAHQMGYGLEYGMLPVAGDFWISRNILNGKVYTVQNDAIPFAALHGDPAVYDRGETRWGPTAKPMPILERGNWDTFREFAGTGMISFIGLWTALRVGANPVIGKFLLKNALYGLPFFGKRAFLSDVRKIVPSMQAEDIRLDKGAGGIRGQLVHLPTRRLAKGKDKLVGDGIIYIMAPSPGASYCLGNALEDAKTLETFLPGYAFDEAAFKRDIGFEDRKPVGRVTVELPS